MKTVPVQEYADSARQRQGPGSDRAMPQTQEKAFSIDTAANTSALRREKRDREETDTQARKSSRSRTEDVPKTRYQRRSPLIEVYNPALYEVLKTRGRLQRNLVDESANTKSAKSGGSRDIGTCMCLLTYTTRTNNWLPQLLRGYRGGFNVSLFKAFFENPKPGHA